MVSWAYCLWLWKISGDIAFEGWVFWKFIPLARFRLISKRSWYARAWARFYGFALFTTIIHRDQIGEWDDAHVEVTLVHEVRHCQQNIILGCLHWVLYVLDFARLFIFTKHSPYYENWFERDARRYVMLWKKHGKPKLFNKGERY